MSIHDPHALICVDPGADTGMSLLLVDSDGVNLYRHTTLAYLPMVIHEQLTAWAGMYGNGRFNLVIEKFTPDLGVTNPDTTAIKVMAICELWYHEYLASEHAADPEWRAQYIERIRVSAIRHDPKRKFISNDVLRRLNVWVKGHANRHVNDATRHGVSWLAERGHRAVCESAWPKDTDDGDDDGHTEQADRG